MIGCQSQVAFLLLLLCLQQAAGVSKSELCTSPEMHEKCGAYTYLRMKPFLIEIEELKLVIQENENQLNYLNNQISTLQAESNTRDENMQNKLDELSDAKLKMSTLESLVSKLKDHIADSALLLWEQKTEIKSLHDQLNNNQTVIEIESNEYPHSCDSAEESVQTINITPDQPIEVLCNNYWIVIQQRMDGSEDFERSFETYKNGFGKLTGEFFIGLEKLHMLTHNQPHMLYIHLQNVNGRVRYAKYDHFEIEGESEDYSLKTLGEYRGTAGDAIRISEGYKFATSDKDNCRKCAHKHGGGWWYGHRCGDSNLNGKYKKTPEKGIYWRTWRGYCQTYKFVQMRIRAKA